MVWGLEAETTRWLVPAPGPARGVGDHRRERDLRHASSRSTRRASTCPYLAKSVTPNATYDQWTIELRDGVQFHDGTPLDADAVKLNLDTYRGLNPKLGARLTPFVFANVADVQVTGPLTRDRHHQDAVARVPRAALRRGPLRDHGAGPARRPGHVRDQPHRHRSVREGVVAAQRAVRRGQEPRLLAQGPAPPRPDHLPPGRRPERAAHPVRGWRARRHAHDEHRQHRRAPRGQRRTARPSSSSRRRAARSRT